MLYLMKDAYARKLQSPSSVGSIIFYTFPSIFFLIRILKFFYVVSNERIGKKMIVTKLR